MIIMITIFMDIITMIIMIMIMTVTIVTTKHAFRRSGGQAARQCHY